MSNTPALQVEVSDAQLEELMKRPTYFSWKSAENEPPILALDQPMHLPPITLRTRVVVDDRTPDEHSADEQRERDERERFLIKRLHDLTLELIAGSSMRANPYGKVKP